MVVCCLGLFNYFGIGLLDGLVGLRTLCVNFGLVVDVLLVGCGLVSFRCLVGLGWVWCLGRCLG